nr:hypothetical protein [Mucilaginibacter sp. L294]
MHNILKEKLRSYIQENNPELLIKLQESFSLTQYLEDKVSKAMPTVMRLLEEDKPGYVIEELAMTEITDELRPSRFHYLQTILEEDFPREYQSFKKAGVLTYETINLIEAGKELLDNFPFNQDSEGDNLLRHAVIAIISEYLN